MTHHFTVLADILKLLDIDLSATLILRLPLLVSPRHHFPLPLPILRSRCGAALLDSVFLGQLGSLRCAEASGLADVVAGQSAENREDRGERA